MDVHLSPEEQWALDYLLEGEFECFGLISTRRDLLVPVICWSYQRTHGRSERTVRCDSIVGVPHRDDAAVLHTLVDLYAGRPVKRTSDLLNVRREQFDQRLADLYPLVRPSDEELYQGLRRLAHAHFHITYILRETSETRCTSTHHFGPLSLLVPIMTNPPYLEAISYMVARPILQLYLTGSFDTEENQQQ